MPNHLPFPQVYSRLREQLTARERIYLVGGCVRDILLGREPKDLDFVTDGDTKKIARTIANQFDGGVYEMDSERHTFRVMVTGEDGKAWILDISKLRGKTIEEDLQSRDFTINAIAIDVTEDGFQGMVDPLNGQEHMLTSLLLACGTDSFQNDPIRVLRGVRLALELNFELAPATQQLMETSAPLLVTVSGERIRDEWVRMLAGSAAAKGLEWLRQLGALSIVLPMFAKANEDAFDPAMRDGWNSTLQRIDWIGKVCDNQFAWAVETQDSIVRDEQLAIHLRHYCGGFLTADRPRISFIKSAALILGLFHMGVLDNPKLAAKQWGEMLAFSQKENRFLQQLLTHHQLIDEMSKQRGQLSRKSIYRFFYNTGEVGIAVCIFALADGFSHCTNPQDLPALAHLQAICGQLLHAYWYQKIEVVAPALLLSGDDLQSMFGLSPGKQIGFLLEQLREAQAIGQVQTREEAIQYIFHAISL